MEPKLETCCDSFYASGLSENWFLSASNGLWSALSVVYVEVMARKSIVLFIITAAQNFTKLRNWFSVPHLFKIGFKNSNDWAKKTSDLRTASLSTRASNLKPMVDNIVSSDLIQHQAKSFHWQSKLERKFLVQLSSTQFASFTFSFLQQTFQRKKRLSAEKKCWAVKTMQNVMKMSSPLGLNYKRPVAMKVC